MINIAYQLNIFYPAASIPRELQVIMCVYTPLGRMLLL